MKRVILTACLCACMVAFTGCSERADAPNEMPSGEQSVESSDESSSESSEMSADNTSAESSGESSAESSEISDPFIPDKEFYVDHEYLASVEDDVLYVRIYLHMDEEALRAEFEEKNPGLLENENLYYYYWPRFLGDYGDRITEEFMSDHGIAYEDVRGYGGMLGWIFGDFYKDTLALMLDDPRVNYIIHIIRGNAELEEF